MESRRAWYVASFTVRVKRSKLALTGNLTVLPSASSCAAQLKADGTQAFCQGILGWDMKQWMVCMHDLGLAGIVSEENYELWAAMFGTRPGASYELMPDDCTLLSDLKDWIKKARTANPGRFGVGNPSEMQQTILALWSAILPSSTRIIEDVCRMIRWLQCIVRAVAAVAKVRAL